MEGEIGALEDKHQTVMRKHRTCDPSFHLAFGMVGESHISMLVWLFNFDASSVPLLKEFHSRH